MSEEVRPGSQAVLVQMQRLLEARGVANLDRVLLVRNGMRPIYSALEEMDRVGVKVRTSRRDLDVVGLNARAMEQTAPLDLRVWDLEAQVGKAIRLREQEGHEGEYVGVMATLTQVGPLWWPQTEETVQDHVHFANSDDAVEWLVEQLAPSVVEAPGLPLGAGDGHAEVPVPGLS
jgi:hypothetical protein